MCFRRTFAVLMAFMLSLSLLPSAALAASADVTPADLIQGTLDSFNYSKTKIEGVVQDWNNSSFSSKPSTESVSVWSDGNAGRTKAGEAFARYAFYKLYGHSDSYLVSEVYGTGEVTNRADVVLHHMKTNAAPGDNVMICFQSEGYDMLEMPASHAHMFNLYDIDANGRIYVYESGYASTNTARAHTYSSIRDLLTNSSVKASVDSSGTINESVLVRYVHSNRNLMTPAQFSCNQASSSSSSSSGSASQTIKYGKVHDTDGNLAINSKPAKGNMIGKIPEGGVCTVYPDKASGSWYWVSYNGVEGYSYGKYITLSDTKPSAGTTTPATPAATTTAKAVHGTVHDTAGNLAINQQPKSTSNGATMLGKIPEGKVCVVYPDKTKNGWYWVEYQGVQGYAYNKYIKLGSDHSLSHVSAREATCTAAGNREYWTCSGCGQCYTDSAGKNYASQSALKLSAAGHTMAHVAAVSPTCTAQGNSEYWYCAVCGKCSGDSAGSSSISQSSTVLAALGHDYQEGSCTRCGVADPDYTPPEEEPETDVDEGVHFPRVNTYRQGQFTDVSADSWYVGNVKEAFVFSLMKGNSATTFNPTGSVTLAEAITIAARIHSIYTTGSESFVQSGDQWFQVYLDYAYRNDIISRSTYSGDVTKKATRAQFAAIFARSLPDKGLAGINTVGSNAVPDVPASASYASGVYKLYRAGVLTGSDAKRSFRPDSTITRAECAAIVSRMAESNNRVAFTLN